MSCRRLCARQGRNTPHRLPRAGRGGNGAPPLTHLFSSSHSAVSLLLLSLCYRSHLYLFSLLFHAYLSPHVLFLLTTVTYAVTISFIPVASSATFYLLLDSTARHPRHHHHHRPRAKEGKRGKGSTIVVIYTRPISLRRSLGSATVSESAAGGHHAL